MPSSRARESRKATPSRNERRVAFQRSVTTHAAGAGAITGALEAADRSEAIKPARGSTVVVENLRLHTLLQPRRNTERGCHWVPRYWVVSAEPAFTQ